MMVLVSKAYAKYLNLVLGILFSFASLTWGSASFAFSNPGNSYGLDGGNAPLSKPCVTTLVVAQIHTWAPIVLTSTTRQVCTARGACHNVTQTTTGPITFSGNTTDMQFADLAPASVRQGGVLCPGTYTVSYSVTENDVSCGASRCDWNINEVTDANGDSLIAQQNYGDGTGSNTHSASSATGAYNTETGGTLSPIQAYTDSSNKLYISSLVVTLTGTSRLP